MDKVMRCRVFAVFLVAIIASLSTLPALANGFESWAAIVVAGDFRAHSGMPAEVYIKTSERTFFQYIVRRAGIPRTIIIDLTTRSWTEA